MYNTRSDVFSDPEILSVVNASKASHLANFVFTDAPEHAQEENESLDRGSEQGVLLSLRGRICECAASLSVATWLRQDKRRIWALLFLAVPAVLFFVALLVVTLGKERTVMRGCYNRYESAHHTHFTLLTTTHATCDLLKILLVITAPLIGC